MLRNAILLAVAISGTCLPAKAGFFGPDNFKVTQSDNRFSESRDLTFVGHNNRISSKSIAGGMHIDASGVYIEPTATKDSKTGQVTFIGLVIMNRSSVDTRYGDVNSLGVPKTISFLLNGSTPIVLQVRTGEIKSSGAPTYNTVGQYASVDVNESGVVSLTKQQFADIVSASSLAVQIQGSNRTVTYEADDISDSFVPNLKSFFEKYVER